MHISLRRRSTFVLLLLAIISSVGYGRLASILDGDRDSAEIAFESAVTKAAQAYRDRTAAQAARDQKQEVLRQRVKESAALFREKRALRLRMVGVRKTITLIEARNHIVFKNRGDIARLLADGTRQSTVTPGSDLPVGCLAFAGWGDSWRVFALEFLLMPTRSYLSWACTKRAPPEGVSAAELRDLTMAEEAAKELERLGRKLLALRKQVQSNAATWNAAAAQAGEAQSRLEQRERSMALLQQDVFARHAELVEQRTGSARDAVREGTMTREEALKQIDDIAAGTAGFAWPVRGWLSAGFLDPKYTKKFGVPHYGQDIAVTHGTSVKSAAPGIVLLARDGGAKGYTYVVVAHREGYATVYGHLSRIDVAAGDVLSAGEPLGLSGGEPGSEGAGERTTGPHLHFEVIENGANINPMGVLP